jgi:PHD/YefM family antitoxin component YafN of YafNO toxin-antitoxin module
MKIKSLLILTFEEMDDLLDIVNTKNINISSVSEYNRLINQDTIVYISYFLLKTGLFNNMEEVIDYVGQDDVSLVFSDMKNNMLKKGIFIPFEVRHN